MVVFSLVMALTNPFTPWLSYIIMADLSLDEYMAKRKMKGGIGCVFLQIFVK